MRKEGSYSVNVDREGGKEGGVDRVSEGGIEGGTTLVCVYGNLGIW